MVPYKPHYSILNKLVQTISATRPISWFLARNLHRIDEIFLKISKGRMTLTNYLAGFRVVIINTTGARSGLPRTMPLAYIADPDHPEQFAILASNLGQPHHPGWYYNLKAHPRATGSIDGQTKSYLAHETSDEEYARFWQVAVKIYPGFILYQKRLHHRRIPIMVLVPDRSPTPTQQDQ